MFLFCFELEKIDSKIWDEKNLKTLLENELVKKMGEFCNQEKNVPTWNYQDFKSVADGFIFASIEGFEQPFSEIEIHKLEQFLGASLNSRFFETKR